MVSWPSGPTIGLTTRSISPCESRVKRNLPWMRTRLISPSNLWKVETVSSMCRIGIRRNTVIPKSWADLWMLLPRRSRSVASCLRKRKKAWLDHERSKKKPSLQPKKQPWLPRIFVPRSSPDPWELRIPMQRSLQRKQPKWPSWMEKNMSLEGWTRSLGGNHCTECAMTSAMHWYKESERKHQRCRKISWDWLETVIPKSHNPLKRSVLTMWSGEWKVKSWLAALAAVDGTTAAACTGHWWAPRRKPTGSRSVVPKWTFSMDQHEKGFVMPHYPKVTKRYPRPSLTIDPTLPKTEKCLDRTEMSVSGPVVVAVGGQGGQGGCRGMLAVSWRHLPWNLSMANVHRHSIWISSTQIGQPSGKWWLCRICWRSRLQKMWQGVYSERRGKRQSTDAGYSSSLARQRHQRQATRSRGHSTTIAWMHVAWSNLHKRQCTA